MNITDLNYIIYQTTAFTDRFCLASIRFEITFFTLVDKDFEIIFKSRFNNEIGLQLEVKLLSLLGFFINPLNANITKWSNTIK